MSATDIAALLEKQQALTAAKADAEKLRKDSAYHARQAARKAAEAEKLEKEAAELQAELDAVTGGAKKEEPPAKKK